MSLKKRHYRSPLSRSLIATSTGTEGWQGHQNKIQSKHVDFVLCKPISIAPLVCVELNDKSLQRQKRVDRDAFLKEALAAAGVPLLEIPAARAYNVAEVRQQISHLLPKPPA